MMLWAALAIGLTLIFATLRMWTEFARTVQRVRAEIEHAREVVVSLTDRLATVKSKTEEVKVEVGVLARDRDELERRVLDERQRLTDLEQRLEKTRPKSRRVDMGSEDSLFG